MRDRGPEHCSIHQTLQSIHNTIGPTHVPTYGQQAVWTGSSKIVSRRIFCQPSGNILSFHRQSLYAVQVQHLGECLISLQIFQAATLPNVPSYVAKSANSSRRLKIPSFVQRLFKIFETFHICHLQRDPSGMRFRLSVPTFVAPMPT